MKTADRDDGGGVAKFDGVEDDIERRVTGRACPPRDPAARLRRRRRVRRLLRRPWANVAGLRRPRRRRVLRLLGGAFAVAADLSALAGHEGSSVVRPSVQRRKRGAGKPPRVPRRTRKALAAQG